jgi:hypothetical protein
MKVIVIVKDTTDYPHEIAHLYEHWFIMSFYKYAYEKSGMHGGVIGYVGGETYNNIVFIEAWFYDEAAGRLFEEFCAREILDSGLLATCLQQCQAEGRELWDIDDHTLLDNQLDGLRQLTWRIENDIEPYIYSDQSSNDRLPITIRKAASHYKAVTIVANLKDAPIEDQAVFLRLYVIIADIIGQYVQRKGWRALDTLSPRLNKDGIYTIVGVSLPRGLLSNNQLSTEVTGYLRQFDVSAYSGLFQAHFAEYAHQPLWKGRIYVGLHDTNVISSNRSIAELATDERIHRIFQSLAISVHTESYAFAKDIPY